MYPLVEMTDKAPITPNNNYKTYVLPETGQVVEARTVDEAVTKAKKQAKEK